MSKMRWQIVDSKGIVISQHSNWNDAFTGLVEGNSLEPVVRLNQVLVDNDYLANVVKLIQANDLDKAIEWLKSCYGPCPASEDLEINTATIISPEEMAIIDDIVTSILKQDRNFFANKTTDSTRDDTAKLNSIINLAEEYCKERKRRYMVR